MNCKQGDLARIVSGGPFERHLIDKIVRVTTISGHNERGEPCWHYEGPHLSDRLGRKILGLCDALLRPIRDNDGEDETLTWAGKPEKVTA